MVNQTQAINASFRCVESQYQLFVLCNPKKKMNKNFTVNKTSLFLMFMGSSRYFMTTP